MNNKKMFLILDCIMYLLIIFSIYFLIFIIIFWLCAKFFINSKEKLSFIQNNIMTFLILGFIITCIFLFFKYRRLVRRRIQKNYSKEFIILYKKFQLIKNEKEKYKEIKKYLCNVRDQDDDLLFSLKAEIKADKACANQLNVIGSIVAVMIAISNKTQSDFFNVISTTALIFFMLFFLKSFYVVRLYMPFYEFVLVVIEELEKESQKRDDGNKINVKKGKRVVHKRIIKY